VQQTARPSLFLLFLHLQMRWPERCFALLASLGAACSLRFVRAKQRRAQIQAKIFGDDHLRLRTKEDDPFTVVMFRFVPLGAEFPHFTSAFDIESPQLHDLARASAGQSLQLDHVSNDGGQVRQRGVDDRFRNRKNWRRLTHA